MVTKEIIALWEEQEANLPTGSWMLRQAFQHEGYLQQLLADGWKPFTAIWNGGNERILFRKQKP